MTARILVLLMFWFGLPVVPATADPTSSPPTVRWATYNIAGLNGWHRRQDQRENQIERGRAMGQAMRAWGATVIGFQELPRDVELQAAIRDGLGAGWSLRSLPINAPEDTLRTVGIAWRNDRAEWSAEMAADERLPAYWGAVDLLIDGRVWRVHVGKLSPGQTEASALKRLGETKKLVTVLTDDSSSRRRRVVILADLNASLAESSLVLLLDSGWRDAMAGFSAAGLATKHDSGEDTYRRRLDYIFLPRDLSGSLANGTVVGDPGFALPLRGVVEPWSDHLPVWVDWTP